MKLKAVVIVLAVFLLMAIPSIAMNQGPWAIPSIEIADEIRDNAIELMITPVDMPQIDGITVYHKPPEIYPRRPIVDITPIGPFDDELDVIHQYIITDVFPFPPGDLYPVDITPIGPFDDELDIVYVRPPGIHTLRGLID